MYTLLYLKWETSKDLLSSTGNSDSVVWQPVWEGIWGEWIRVYVWLSPFAVRLETTGIVNWLRDGGLFTKSGPTLVTP